MRVEMRDISAEVFGKYQFCTKGPDGKWYSDQDFEYGNGCGEPKEGAIPSPREADRSPYMARPAGLREKGDPRATGGWLDAIRQLFA